MTEGTDSRIVRDVSKTFMAEYFIQKSRVDKIKQSLKNF